MCNGNSVVCEWDMLTPAEFVGWQNFETLLNDQRLRTVIINTLIFAVPP